MNCLHPSSFFAQLLVEAEGAVGGDALAVRQPAVAQTGITFERARDDSQDEEASQQHFMVRSFRQAKLMANARSFFWQNAQTAFDDASSHRLQALCSLALRCVP